MDGSSGNDGRPRVGPSIVLKVMAGDTVTIGTYAWYQGAVEPPPSGASNLLNDLLKALTGGVISNSHSLYSTTDNNPNTVLSGDLPYFFTHNEDSLYETAAPKAFLNWVAFDNQMNMVSVNSGVVQVPTITGSEQAQPLVAPEQIIQKDGYIYIYVSNESAQKVFFDNLVIHHNRGPILQTDNYYPFGLTMAGISDQAALSLENKFLYNGIELNHKEFSDGSGLELYTAQFRGLDPQIGRWWQIDPRPTYDESPYAAMGDEPILNSDFLGDTVIGNSGAIQGYLHAINQGIQQGVTRVNKLFQESLKASGNKLKRLDRRIANAQGTLNGFVAARNEYNVLNSSSQIYNVVTDVTNLSADAYGATRYNSKEGYVDVEVSATAPYPTATLAHELKHAYQYQMQETDLRYNGTGSGPLDDLHDELEAYQRGALFGDNTSGNVTIDMLEKMYPGEAAGPINASSSYPYGLHTETYGQAINEQLFREGTAGIAPIIITYGWQSSYFSGWESNKYISLMMNY